MKISAKTHKTCVDALEILVENSAENVVCAVGHDLDLDYLKKVVADGPTDEIHDYEIDEIQEYVDRREALTELTELQISECSRNGHKDTGRGVCANCGTFLPSSDGEYWA